MAAASPIVDVDSAKIAHSISAVLAILKKKRKAARDVSEVERHLAMVNWNVVSLRAQTLATETTLATFQRRSEVMAAIPREAIRAGRRKVIASRAKVATSLRQLRAAHAVASSFPGPLGPRLASTVGEAIEALTSFAAMIDRSQQLFELELDSRHAEHLIREPDQEWVPWEQTRKSFGL